MLLLKGLSSSQSRSRNGSYASSRDRDGCRHVVGGRRPHDAVRARDSQHFVWLWQGLAKPYPCRVSSARVEGQRRETQ